MSTSVHGDKTRGDDNAILILEFDGGVTAMAEESWTKPGGMDDRAEVYGSQGVAYADLLQGNSILTYSTAGYDYAVEKAGSTRGWSFTIYEELWNYGFPQEMAHFVDCVQNDKQPAVTGEDGRAVLEVLFAAYASAASGRQGRASLSDRRRAAASTCGAGRSQSNSLIALHPKGRMTALRKAIGIDIGGTKIAVAAVDAAGAIVARNSIRHRSRRGVSIGPSTAWSRPSTARSRPPAGRAASCAAWASAAPVRSAPSAA